MNKKLTMKEIRERARKEFYAAHGYYPTVEDAIRLTDEARTEIAKEKRLGTIAFAKTANPDEKDEPTNPCN